MRKSVLLAAALLGSAAAGASASLQAPAPGAAVTVLGRATTTATGQNIRLPQGEVEVIVSRTEIPVGGVLPMHKHPWPRYAYIESGRLRVHWEQAGLTREFGPGDVVFEPFSGSGSQLIAAERTGRRCRAIEISPPFVDVAIRRWQKATGLDATLDGDGRTFADIAIERGAQ